MVEGIIPLWKEKGMTSHDAVYKVRKILKIKKVGHSGTLDPDVEGVLPICVGSATKIVDYLVQSGKVYTGEIKLDNDLEWYCPNCGNRDKDEMQVMRRTCGYIGANMWGKERTQEIGERVLHL